MDGHGVPGNLYVCHLIRGNNVAALRLLGDDEGANARPGLINSHRIACLGVDLKEVAIACRISHIGELIGAIPIELTIVGIPLHALRDLAVCRLVGKVGMVEEGGRTIAIQCEGEYIACINEAAIEVSVGVHSQGVGWDSHTANGSGFAEDRIDFNQIVVHCDAI